MRRARESRRLPVAAPRIGASVLLATLAINLLALALPLVLLQVFDRVIPNESYETLTVLFLGLLVALALDFAFKICRIVVLGAQGETFELHLTEKALDHVLNARASDFDDVRTGTHVDRQDAIATLRDFYSGQSRLVNIDLPFTLIFAGMIYLIGGWLVAVPVACFAILVGARWLLKFAQSPVLAARRANDERRLSFLMEFVSQIVTAKSLGMEPQMLRRHEVLQDSSVRVSRRFTLVAQFSQAFGAVFSHATVAAMGLFGSYLAITDRIGIAELAACMLLNGRTVQPMLQVLGFWVQLETVEASRAKLRDLFSTPQRTARTAATLEGGLVLKGVRLRIPGMEGTPLRAEIAPGECLGITGSTGSGKSRLIAAILAEATPAEGRILIDGASPETFAEARGKGGILHVGSTPTIFDGTIMDNLSLFGDADAKDRAAAAARSIGLEEDIHRLPLGYDTPIRADSGMTRGWLQRICIARALALEPSVLLLDEASTALDHSADSQLLSALADLRGRTTLVLASHRPSWLSLADQVLDLSAAPPAVAHAAAASPAQNRISERLSA